MDSYFIKLSGKFNIPEPLEVDSNLVLGLEVEVDDERKKSNKNGEYDFTYTCPALRGEIVTNLGKKIKFEKKTSDSALLNAQLRMIARERNLDEDKFYHETMVLLRHHTLAVLDFLEGLSNE